MRRLLAAALALWLAACGARSTLSTGDEDASPAPTRDGGRDDAGRDAGRINRDAGTDAGQQTLCRRDVDCANGFCRAFEGLIPRDLEPMPLTCGRPDPAEPDLSSCEQRSDCARGLCTLSGTCVRPCVTGRDCDASEQCVETLIPTTPRSLQTLSACAPIVVAPPNVRVVGPEPAPTVVANMTPGAIDTLRLIEPDSLTVWRGEAGSQPFIQRITGVDPPNAVFYDESRFIPGAPAPDWGITPIALGDLITLLYPNGPNTPAPGSGLDVELLASVGGTELSRFIAQRSGPVRGVFDLDLYFVGGQDWEVLPGEALPPALRRGLTALRNLLEPSGLSIGEVRAHNVVGQTRERFEFLVGGEPPFNAPAELDDLFRLSAGGARPSVNVFFVRAIEGALGIASGIPGAQIFHGSGASGVAISGDLLPVDEIGATLAHEIGHYMGMFHTSEAAGDTNDPFTDTEECGRDRDANGDGFLDEFECQGFGAQYVMFWSASGGEFSAQQGELMRRAYFVE